MKSCLILPQQQQPSCWQPRVQSGLSSSWHRGVEAHEPGEQQQTWDRKPRSDDKRSEEHTSELQSLMRISYAVFCLTEKTHTTQSTLECKTHYIYSNTHINIY